MKQNGKEDHISSKKRRSNQKLKATTQSDIRLRNTVMKTNQSGRKKKESKTLDLGAPSKDTVAETIAFVIKGQLTPIKPTLLSMGKTAKYVNKRLQKTRFCKIKENKTDGTNTKVLTKIDKNQLERTALKASPINLNLNSDVNTKTTRVSSNSLSKYKKTSDLDFSIKKIIKKYAQKLNVKDGKEHDIVHKNKRERKKYNNARTASKNKNIVGGISKNANIIEPKGRIRKPSVSIVAASTIVKPRRKFVKRIHRSKDGNNDENLDDFTLSKDRESEKADERKSETISVPIKQETIDEVLPLAVKKEPGVVSGDVDPCEESMNHIKKEPVLDIAEMNDAIKELSKSKSKIREDKDPTDQKKSKKSKKLKLLKKKSLVKKSQQQLEDKRRAKLLQFWNSPKRHRVASLNAIAKVHCLYENESKAIFDRITENAIIKEESCNTDVNSKQNKRQVNSGRAKVTHFISDSEDEEEAEEQPVKRILRDVPGLRAVGKHWDMHDSISSDNNSDIEIYNIPKKVVKVKKEVLSRKTEKPDKPKKIENEKQQRKRKPKQEVFMDLKDMVVKKRMASLNASAILAASYSTDKKMKPGRSTDSSSYDSDSSAEEYFAAVDEINLTKDIKEDIKQDEEKNLIEVHTTPNKKVAVILNQDTDLTITGVYVNSTTRSTHHEGYCNIAGMQYRISATSHTQTAATAVATETLLQSSGSSDNAHSDAQSCSSKSYTPLDALSNMQPPPGPGIHNAPPSHSGIPCQPVPQIGSPQHRQHLSSSAFSPPHHAPPGYPPPPPVQAVPPQQPSESPVGYTHDSVYLSSLLEHAKRSRLNLDEPEVESFSLCEGETNNISQSLLSPVVPHRLPKNGLDNNSLEDLLISLIQVRPALWDSRLPLMERSKTIKDRLWLEIYINFKGDPLITLELLQKKWKNLKDNFIKTKSEADAYVPTGSGALKKKKVWKHFESLKFLSDTIAPRKTTCSLSRSNPGPSNESEPEAQVEVKTKKNLKRSMIKPELDSCGPENKILKAINKIVETPESPQSKQINPICIKISDLLEKMPIKERTRAEIQLLQQALHFSEDFI